LTMRPRGPTVYAPLPYSAAFAARLAVPRISVPSLPPSCAEPRSSFAGQAGDVDAYLAGREAAFTDIIPGTEKCVAWAGAPGVKTPLAIVYTHGWQGSRQEYVPVFDLVARELRANVYYARLTGHGRGGEAIKDATLEDWLADMTEAYQIGRRIGERVILAAPSMGANLSLWLASHRPPELAALVLISAAIQPAVKLSELLLLPSPFREAILHMAVGKYFPSPKIGERHARFNPPRYRAEGAIPLMATVKLVRDLDVQSITTPSLWIYAERDRVIDVRHLKKAYNRIGGPRVTTLPGICSSPRPPRRWYQRPSPS